MIAFAHAPLPDTLAIVFDTVKVLLALIIFSIIAYKLGWKANSFTWVERTGMGFIAAGAMMLIGPITLKPSPFDDWAMVLFLTGNAVYFVGRLTRHWLRNRQQENRYWKR